MFIFLQPVVKKLTVKDLLIVLAEASVVAFGVFALFALTGDMFFENVLQVQFDSFRIFGGMVITYLSFVMIVQGKKSFISYDENRAKISSQIVMPLMVGAGTISLSVLMKNRFGEINAVMALSIVMIITYIMVVILSLLYKMYVRKYEATIDRIADIALRLIAFFAGAIGIDMLVVGVQNLLM